MSLRHVARTIAVSGAAVLCGALFLLSVDSGVAGAALVNGFTTLTPTGSTGTPTAGTPYSDGQTIDVNVAAGTGTQFCPGSTTVSANPNPLSSSYQVNCGAAPAPSGSYYFEECDDPGGTAAGLPTGFSGCEAGTQDIESGTVSTGAVESPTFTVYVLPDVPVVGGPTSTGTCGVAPNYCVIGIFSADPNSGGKGFSYPHLFSAPFQIVPNTDGQTIGTAGYTPDGSNPGDGTPELSLAIGLPLAAMGIVGGVLVRNRRRHRRAAA